jgi:multidrug efflux pump subunit AcrB
LYIPFLNKAIKNRYVTLASFIALLMITIGLFGGGFVRFVFFPNIPSDFITATISLEPGSSIIQRDKAIKRVLESLYAMDEQFVDDTGGHAVKHSLAYETGNIGGQVLAELTKAETREIDAFEIQKRWRELVPEIPGIKSFSIASEGGPDGGNDISFEFSSSDLVALREATTELKNHLSSYDGVADINDSFSGGSDEIRLNIKPEAEALGLTLNMLATQVRYGFYGAEAQRVQRGDEEVKVMVRYPKDQRNSIGNLESMRIRTIAGEEIPFSEVANIDMAQGYGSIIRVDGNRSLSVTAKADKTLIDPNEVAKDVQDNFIPGLLARYPAIEFRLEGASKEQQEAVQSLLKGFVFALLVIYALMAIPLKSYVQPLLIMSIIPFGIVGAIVGHILLGHAVSVLSMCGIIALSGVVVNDSLILVDFVNQNRADGKPLLESVIESGRRRFRPIILTSLTTFMGLVPILFERSLQAQIVIPMAISLAFGILFATVITLILVPCLYIILNDFQQFLKRMISRLISSLGYKEDVQL